MGFRKQTLSVTRSAQADEEEPDDQENIVIFRSHVDIGKMADNAKDSQEETANPSYVHLFTPSKLFLS